jgi:hypothetical protein
VRTTREESHWTHGESQGQSSHDGWTEFQLQGAAAEGENSAEKIVASLKILYLSCW